MEKLITGLDYIARDVEIQTSIGRTNRLYTTLVVNLFPLDLSCEITNILENQEAKTDDDPADDDVMPNCQSVRGSQGILLLLMSVLRIQQVSFMTPGGCLDYIIMCIILICLDHMNNYSHYTRIWITLYTNFSVSQYECHYTFCHSLSLTEI